MAVDTPYSPKPHHHCNPTDCWLADHPSREATSKIEYGGGHDCGGRTDDTGHGMGGKSAVWDKHGDSRYRVRKQPEKFDDRLRGSVDIPMAHMENKAAHLHPIIHLHIVVEEMSAGG